MNSPASAQDSIPEVPAAGPAPGHASDSAIEAACGPAGDCAPNSGPNSATGPVQPSSVQPDSAKPHLIRFKMLRLHLPTVPDALAALVSLIVVTLFLHTFVLQPYLIPSESMEHTLLVGDFLLFNKQVYAPAGELGWILPYRPVERGDIIVFHHPSPPLLVKRVVGLPGDRLRIEDGQVYVNGSPLEEPYATFEPALPDNSRDNFPARIYPGPPVDPDWWRQMESITRNG